MKQENPKEALEVALDYSEREWTKLNLEVEIMIAEGGRITPDGEERQIKEWSIESANHRRFFMYVIRATYEKRSITIADLVKKLNASRPTVMKMMNDCLERKWIENQKCSKGHNHLSATPIVMQCYENYAKWLWLVYDRFNLRDLSTQIATLKKELGNLQN